MPTQQRKFYVKSRSVKDNTKAWWQDPESDMKQMQNYRPKDITILLPAVGCGLNLAKSSITEYWLMWVKGKRWNCPHEHEFQYQDQDSLLVKRRNDNHSPGPVIRELVPSSHQRSELSNTILCIFSRWDQRVGEGIPIPDSLGEEATFINICISNGSLKCHRVLISTTPSLGDKVICWYTGFTLKSFI